MRPTPQTSTQSNVHHRQPNPWHTLAHSSTIPNQTQSADETNELFTPSELLQLTQEMILSLRGCKNKIEQFNTITELAIKYLYHGF